MVEYPFETALVTGASSGIGEVMVGLLADAGVSTVVVARRADRLHELAARHDGIEVLVADLTTQSGQAAVVDRVRDDDAPIDLVVNNAGFGTNGKFHELEPDRLADEIELNIAALTRISNAALSVMVPRGRGWLLNVASIAAFQPAPELAVYAATKAYVANLTESLHEETRGSEISVTALCPGLTRTEFQSVSNTDSYVDKFPDFVWTTPEEVAATGLRDVVKGKALSVPGAVYKSMALTTGVTPRGVLRRMSGLLQRG